MNCIFVLYTYMWLASGMNSIDIPRQPMGFNNKMTNFYIIYLRFSKSFEIELRILYYDFYFT